MAMQQQLDTQSLGKYACLRWMHRTTGNRECLC